MLFFIFQKSVLKPPTSVGKGVTVHCRRSKLLIPSTLIGGGSSYRAEDDKAAEYLSLRDLTKCAN